MSHRTLRAQSRSFQTEHSYQMSRDNSLQSNKSSFPSISAYPTVLNQSGLKQSSRKVNQDNPPESNQQIKIKRLLQSKKILQAIVEMDKITESHDLIVSIKYVLQYTELNYKTLQQKQSQTLIEWSLQKLQDFNSEVPLIISCINNLASILKRFGDYQTSFDHLEQAVIILEQNDQCLKGQTYLNITSVLSILGQHEKALEFAERSVKICQQEFQREMDGKHLIFAFHNYAVELDHTKQIEKALIQHQKASEYAENLFGMDDKLSKILRNAFINAKNGVVTTPGNISVSKNRQISRKDSLSSLNSSTKFDQIPKFKIIDSSSQINSLSKLDQIPKFKVIKQSPQVLQNIKTQIRQKGSILRPNNYLEDKQMDQQSGSDSKVIPQMIPQSDFANWTDSDDLKQDSVQSIITKSPQLEAKVNTKPNNLLISSDSQMKPMHRQSILDTQAKPKDMKSDQKILEIKKKQTPNSDVNQIQVKPILKMEANPDGIQSTTNLPIQSNQIKSIHTIEKKPEHLQSNQNFEYKSEEHQNSNQRIERNQEKLPSTPNLVKKPSTEQNIVLSTEAQLILMELEIFQQVEASQNSNQIQVVGQKKQEQQILASQSQYGYSITDILKMVRIQRFSRRYLIKKAIKQLQIEAQERMNDIGDPEPQGSIQFTLLQVALSTLMQGHEKQIIQIQTQLRGYSVRHLSGLKQQIRDLKSKKSKFSKEQSTIISKFSLPQRRQEYGFVFVSSLAKNTFVRCYNGQLSALSNSLQVHKEIIRNKKLTQKNFSELFEYNYLNKFYQIYTIKVIQNIQKHLNHQLKEKSVIVTNLRANRYQSMFF